MNLTLKSVDPRHGRDIPTGDKLARLLRLLFGRIRDAEGDKLLTGNVDLSRWIPVIVQAVEPLLIPLYAAGAKAGLERLARQVRRRTVPVRWIRRKDSLATAFDVFNPRVMDAVRNQLFMFAESTLETIAGNVRTAMDAFRAVLGEGLEEGVALRELASRVYAIFDDPQRAYTIAATEASRAHHTGQYLAAKESGVVTGKEWLASGDACPLCLELDGKEVGLDEPFYVDPKGGPYAVVMFPPRHPRCMCSYTDIVG